MTPIIPIWWSHSLRTKVQFHRYNNPILTGVFNQTQVIIYLIIFHKFKTLIKPWVRWVCRVCSRPLPWAGPCHSSIPRGCRTCAWTSLPDAPASEAFDRQPTGCFNPHPSIHPSIHPSTHPFIYPSFWTSLTSLTLAPKTCPLGIYWKKLEISQNSWSRRYIITTSHHHNITPSQYHIIT